MNQAVSFGLLLGGGVLLYSSLTGTSLSQIAQGRGGTVSNQPGGPYAAGGALNSGVAGIGSAVTSAVSKVAGQLSSSYTNPFAAATMVTPERIDQGQDFSLAAGSPILAPGNSTFLGQVSNWYQGQPYLAYRLDTGPLAGSNYYVAEQVQAPSGLKPGQTVKQGQPIAYYTSSGTGLEIGWAGTGGNWTQTLAQQSGATNASQGHANTPSGLDFHQFLIDIGAVK